MQLLRAISNLFKTKYSKDLEEIIEPLEVCPYCSVWYRGLGAKKLITYHIAHCTRKPELLL